MGNDSIRLEDPETTLEQATLGTGAPQQELSRVLAPRHNNSEYIFFFQTKKYRVKH